MAKAFGEVIASAEAATLTHAEWLALLLDREMTYRYDKKLAGRLRYARLRHQAAVEDVDYRSPRGLDRALSQADHRRLDRGARQFGAVRSNRHRQELARLRSRP
jgi:hypothetical protein